MPYYDYALDMVLDVEMPMEDSLTEEQQEIVESAAVRIIKILGHTVARLWYDCVLTCVIYRSIGFVSVLYRRCCMD